MEVNIDDLHTKQPLHQLSESSLNALAEVAVTRKYAKGEQIFKIGDSQRMAVFLIKGSVTLESIDGRVTSIDLSHSMSEYALSNLKPRMYTATVASDDTVLFWVKDEVLNKLISESLHSQGIAVSDELPVNTRFAYQAG